MPLLGVIGTKPSVSADPSAFKAPLVDELNLGVTDFAKTSRDPSWINIPTFPGVAIRDKFGNEHWLYGIAFVYLRLNPAGFCRRLMRDLQHSPAPRGPSTRQWLI